MALGQAENDLTLETVFVQNEAMLFADVGDGTALMDIDRGEYFQYESVGSRIWELIDGKATVAQICAQLTEEYDVDRATCEQQTMAFLGKLQELNHANPV